jgi:hypothetical protein
MKNIKTFILLLAITMFSCDNNDDAQTDPVTPTDGFTHNNVFTPTANAYFEIDEDDNNPSDGYPDNYNFFFLDGRMADGDDPGAPATANEYVFSLNTDNFVFFNLKVQDNPSLANSAPVAGGTYVGDLYNATANATPNTVIVENYTGSMIPFSTPYFINGVEYGNPSGDDYSNAQGANPAPTITVNAINIDSSNPSLSTIDVDYFYVNAAGETFTGHYEGTLGIILD